MRILLLPGSGSPVCKFNIEAYSDIADEARRRDCEFRMVAYPGQEGISSGTLSYATALQKSLQVADEFCPDWIISISLGCIVCAGMVATKPGWMRHCAGIVFWGPYLGSTFRRRWNTPATKAEATRVHRVSLETYFANDYFDVHPDLENMMGLVEADLRLAMGFGDHLISQSELAMLAELHRQSFQTQATETVVLNGAGHFVIPKYVPLAIRQQYFNILFDPIRIPVHGAMTVSQQLLVESKF